MILQWAEVEVNDVIVGADGNRWRVSARSGPADSVVTLKRDGVAPVTGTPPPGADVEVVWRWRDAERLAAQALVGGPRPPASRGWIELEGDVGPPGRQTAQQRAANETAMNTAAASLYAAPAPSLLPLGAVADAAGVSTAELAVAVVRVRLGGEVIAYRESETHPWEPPELVDPVAALVHLATFHQGVPVTAKLDDLADLLRIHQEAHATGGENHVH